MAAPSRRGIGNVRQLNSGRWQVRFVDPMGIRRTAGMTFSTKAQAEKELSRIVSSISNRTWTPDLAPQPGEINPKNVTLAELAAHWRSQRTKDGRRLSPKTLYEYERLIRVPLGRFANKPIRSITLTQIEKWRNDELDRAPNQTVKAFKQLKTLLTWAHKRKWISENPCDFIDGATTYKWEEPEVPTDAQVEHMLDNAPEPYRTIIALAVFGGLRKGEILELRRKDIEIKKVQKEAWVRVSIKRAVVWVKGEAIVKAPKSSKSVRVIQLPLPATPFVKNLLKSMNSIDPEALLFSRDPEGKRHFLEYQLDSPWRQIKKSSGFNGRFHSLRTYHETRLAKSTSSPKQLMDRLGHEDLKTTMLYLRNGGEEDEREVLRKW